MERFVQEHAASLREVSAANRDLALRLTTLSVQVRHDRDDDTFVLTIGEPQEAITESVRNRLFYRLDPDTLKIVGIEIPHVSARLAGDPTLASILRRLLPLTALDSPQAAEIARDLEELIPR
jgi:hypothetical protein